MTKLMEGPVAGELTLSGLWLILKRRHKLITVVAGACVGLVVVACIFMTPRYEAVGEIQWDRSNPDGLRIEEMANAAEGESNVLEANLALQTQAKILESNNLALQVIGKLNLENTRDFRPRLNPIAWVLGAISREGPGDPLNASLEQSPQRRSRALKIFSGNLKIKPVAGTRLIDVSYMSSDRAVAANVVNQLISSLIDYHIKVRIDSTNQASEWLRTQMDDLKGQAEQEQARVAKLQRDAGVFSLSDANGKELAYNATLERLQQATEALSTATSNRIIKGGVYELVRNGDPELISGLAGTSLAGMTQAVSSSFGLLQNLRGQQAAVRAQMANDMSKYGSANPKLGDEQASLTALDETVKDEVHRIGERVENDYHAAQTVEHDQQAVFLKERATAEKLNDKAIDYIMARQQAVDSRQLYETLHSRLKAAGVLEGLRSSNISVVNTALPPAKPARPNVPLYLAFALCGGMFLGTSAAFVADATDSSIRGLEMLEEVLQTRILAVLPSVSKKLAKEFTALAVPNSAFIEALRGLRTTLGRIRSGPGPKVILVTSAMEEEGKTMISLNLAAVLVQGDARVLLVEADMRHPGLSRLIHFDNSSAIGLSSLLAGNDKQPQLQGISELPNLSLLPAGAVPSYPSELLGAKGLRTLVKQWSAAYDYVIIDSPPILVVTDALILSRLADLTLLVARAGVSTRSGVKRAHKMLMEDGSGEVAVVLNGVSEDYGYKYKHSKYYSEAA